MMENVTETQEHLNIRYARALMPLTVIFGIFTVVGILGNILTLVVFSLSKEYRNNNFKIFVICLGIIDLLTCLFLIPAEMVKQWNYFTFDNVGVCKVKCFLNVWAGVAAALSLLIISVDRFRKVCQPLKKQISPSLAIKLCCALSFVVPVALSWPGAMMCGIETTNMTNMYGNSTPVNLCLTEEKYKNSKFRKMYKLGFVVLLVGVSFVCLVLYVLIGRQIMKHWNTTPSGFRKDSAKELNSDYSSDTFGVARKAGRSQSSEGGSSLAKEPLQKTSSIDSNASASSARPKLVKQSSSVDVEEKAKRSLIKQVSSNSFSLKNSIRGRTMSRQNSTFVMRQFPYKTLIWFVLTLVFVVTYVLYLILAMRVNALVEMEPHEFALFTSFYRLYFINNAINPIIYWALDKRFRKACKNLPHTIKTRFSSRT